MGEKPINLEFRRAENWGFGLGLCPECFEVYKTMKHIKADNKALECPNCGCCRSFYISGKIIHDVVEGDLLEGE